MASAATRSGGPSNWLSNGQAIVDEPIYLAEGSGLCHGGRIEAQSVVG